VCGVEREEAAIAITELQARVRELEPLVHELAAMDCDE
jgi:hypothetical protein